jgi:hypothetical protein
LFIEYVNLGFNLAEIVFDFHDIAILIISLMLSVALFAELYLAVTVLCDTNVSEWQGMMFTERLDLDFLD